MSAAASKPSSSPLVEAWANVRREWQASVRLRWGVRFIVATVWLWLTLLAQDQAAAWRAQGDELQAEAQRLKPLRSQTGWPQRAEDARTQLESARGLLWTAASQGQVEALLQDRLRELCSKAGLTVRELAILATDAKGTPDDARPLRMRLAVDINNRLALMGLLSELAQSPQSIIVDSLRLRPQAAPPRAEIEIRVLYREQAKAP